MAHFFNNGEQASYPSAENRVALPEEQTSITGSILRGHYDKEKINGYDPFQTNVEPSRPSEARREMKCGSPSSSLTIMTVGIARSEPTEYTADTSYLRASSVTPSMLLISTCSKMSRCGMPASTVV